MLFILSCNEFGTIKKKAQQLHGPFLAHHQLMTKLLVRIVLQLDENIDSLIDTQ
ncbi:MAG: hypothetical protein ACI92I_000012 [Acidimicrobiales bacterium]|jgi:hypothetical protein